MIWVLDCLGLRLASLCVLARRIDRYSREERCSRLWSMRGGGAAKATGGRA